MLKRIFKTVDERFIVKWFPQKTYRPGIQSSVARFFIKIGGHEYDGCAVAVPKQPLLEVDSIQAGHVQISDQARSARKTIGLKEFAGG